MSNCRQQVPPFVDIACEVESGRINAFALITQEKGELADASPTLLATPSFYTDEDYAADVIIYQSVSGGYSAADATISGKGNQQERLGGKKHTATMRVEGVKGNEGHFNKLNISTNYRVVLITDDYQVLLFSTTNCSISANIVLEDSLESILEWDVVINWSDILLPVTSDVPLGVFQ